MLFRYQASFAGHASHLYGKCSNKPVSSVPYARYVHSQATTRTNIIYSNIVQNTCTHEPLIFLTHASLSDRHEGPTRKTRARTQTPQLLWAAHDLTTKPACTECAGRATLGPSVSAGATAKARTESQVGSQGRHPQSTLQGELRGRGRLQAKQRSHLAPRVQHFWRCQVVCHLRSTTGGITDASLQNS